MSFGNEVQQYAAPKSVNIRDAVLMQTLGLGSTDPFENAIAGSLEASTKLKAVEVGERVLKLSTDHSDNPLAQDIVTWVMTGKYVPTVRV